MTSCKEHPFSTHIEILLMMTQSNKVFMVLILLSTAIRFIEDPQLVGFLQGNQQGYFVFYKQNFYHVCYHQR